MSQLNLTVFAVPAPWLSSITAIKVAKYTSMFLILHMATLRCYTFFFLQVAFFGVSECAFVLGALNPLHCLTELRKLWRALIKSRTFARKAPLRTGVSLLPWQEAPWASEPYWASTFNLIESLIYVKLVLLYNQTKFGEILRASHY
jgi:hypothetical protein